MWLIELHIAISILCLVSFIGFCKVYREIIVNNDWTDGTRKNIFNFIFFFVPIMNLLLVLGLFFMIGVEKKEWNDFLEREK